MSIIRAGTRRTLYERVLAWRVCITLQSTGLTSLNLSFNPLGNSASSHIMDLLVQFPQLKALLLADCDFNVRFLAESRVIDTFKSKLHSTELWNPSKYIKLKFMFYRNESWGTGFELQSVGFKWNKSTASINASWSIQLTAPENNVLLFNRSVIVIIYWPL